MKEILPVTMPDGTLVWARVDIVDGRASAVVRGEGPSDVGIEDRAAAAVRGLQETLHSAVTSVREGLRAASPDQVTVEFGMELATADGGVVAALTGVTGGATIKVTATWGQTELAAG
ncbi:hypothetical protein K7640_22835 [Micromonospora sp. PLK6-60]|uniref:CU044_2847 family protein n=1 Tax=Micromonospora sp. PLK6-60 TaxID=2873383 RepID=UPI001CA6519E|nr:CU044_2847 family protein [Micromonospora sp. PLK6-60]MBY8874668.1 hypothetical protein [Micromonospora sp. PLK6-60]